jgi:hypothetical protein
VLQVQNGVSNLKSCFKSESSIKIVKKVIFSPSVLAKERKAAALIKPATPCKVATSFASAVANDDENENMVETFDNNTLEEILGSQSARDLDERSNNQVAPPSKRISIYGPPIRVARKVNCSFY